MRKQCFTMICFDQKHCRLTLIDLFGLHLVLFLQSLYVVFMVIPRKSITNFAQMLRFTFCHSLRFFRNFFLSENDKPQSFCGFASMHPHHTIPYPHPYTHTLTARWPAGQFCTTGPNISLGGIWVGWSFRK